MQTTSDKRDCCKMQQSLINDEYLLIVVFSDENEINISQRDTCILRFSSFIIHYSLKGSVAGNFATLPNYSPLYFRRVARPPRMCRSWRFLSRTVRTCRYSRGSHMGSRWHRSLCTVDLEIPKCFAAARTVAPVSMMYTASCRARSSILSVIKYPSDAVSLGKAMRR